jgi:NADPH:quinone reductase-like Zn-dependent oxidoreductase
MPGVDYSSVSAWRISEFTGIDQLHLVRSAVSPPARKQLAVQIHAVSLNYRDLITVEGQYGGQPMTAAS